MKIALTLVAALALTLGLAACNKTVSSGTPAAPASAASM